MMSAEQQVYEHCSRCGTPLTDLRIFVALSIGVDRLKETGVWESIPNLDQMTREVLCKECFDEFAAVLEQMNTSSDPATRQNIHQQQLNPLHREGVLAEGDEPGIQPPNPRFSPEKQAELDEAYRAKNPIPQAPQAPQPEASSIDDLRKINPAEALRREVAATATTPSVSDCCSDPEPQIDPVLGKLSPERQRELDERYVQKLAEKTATKGPMENAAFPAAKQEELDRQFRASQPPTPAPQSLKGQSFPAQQQAEMDAAYRARLSQEQTQPPVQASSGVYRPDFSGDDTQTDDSIGMTVTGPNVQGLRQQAPSSPSQNISQSIIDQQRALDLEYEKRMLARSSTDPSVRQQGDPSMLNLVEMREDVSYKTQQ